MLPISHHSHRPCRLHCGTALILAICIQAYVFSHDTTADQDPSGCAAVAAGHCIEAPRALEDAINVIEGIPIDPSRVLQNNLGEVSSAVGAADGSTEAIYPQTPKTLELSSLALGNFSSLEYEPPPQGVEVPPHEPRHSLWQANSGAITSNNVQKSVIAGSGSSTLVLSDAAFANHASFVALAHHDGDTEINVDQRNAAFGDHGDQITLTSNVVLPGRFSAFESSQLSAGNYIEDNANADRHTARQRQSNTGQVSARTYSKVETTSRRRVTQVHGNYATVSARRSKSP